MWWIQKIHVTYKAKFFRCALTVIWKVFVSRKPHMLKGQLLHMARALSARPLSRKIPNLFSFFYFVVVLIEVSKFSTGAAVQGRKLSKLCGFACKCS